MVTRSGGEVEVEQDEETEKQGDQYEEVDLKDTSPPHQWTESSDGEVGSLIDCLEEEEEEEDTKSLTDDHDGDDNDDDDDDNGSAADDEEVAKVMAVDQYDCANKKKNESLEKKNTTTMTGAAAAALANSSVAADAAIKYKLQQARLKEVAAKQMAKQPAAVLPNNNHYYTNPRPPLQYNTVAATTTTPIHKAAITIPYPDGMIAFNLNEPWQRSMLKQLEQQSILEPDTTMSRPKRSCERIFVGHTESRDYAVSWDDDASAFSLDTTASSTTPSRIQFVHRMLLANQPIPPTVGGGGGGYHGPDPVTTPTKPEGRDDSTTFMAKVVPVEPTSPRTVTEHPTTTATTTHHRKNRPIGNYIIDFDPNPTKKNVINDNHNNNMDNSMGTSAADTTTDPACYCLGYNMLDYLLIGDRVTTPPVTNRRGNARRISSRPLVRVLENEPMDEQQPQHPQHHRHHNNHRPHQATVEF